MGYPTSASILTFVIVATVRLIQANLSENNTLRVSSDQLRVMSVSVDIVSNTRTPGVLLYNRKSEALININYSLNCTSKEHFYTIFATTSAERVAQITANYVFNISCADLKLSNETQGEQKKVITHYDNLFSEEPPALGEVTGQVNMTVKAHTIGRAFLTLVAQKFDSDDSFKKSVTVNDRSGNTSFYEYNGPLYDLIARTINGNTANGAVMLNQDFPVVSPRIVGKALIIVMQFPRTVDEIFRIILYVAIVLATIGMGVKVDLVVIKQVLRRPTAPIIGLCCQYICMPLIAFTVAKLVPQDSAAVSLGIFTCGIVPGGGTSNMFTYLLGGDLSLSVTMTAMSNIAALALLPMWIFTLGETFKDDTVQLYVPYEKILEALAVVILPLFLGIFIKYKLPKVNVIIDKILKPVLIVIVTFTISLGIYTNVYIFEMIRPMTIVAGCLLPYIGYILGGLISFLCCRSWSHIKTIAIETGIQNTSIAFLILYLSLPPPDNQLAAVSPASSAIMTPLPLFIAVLFYILYQRCQNKRADKQTNNLNVINNENENVDQKEGKIVAIKLLRSDEAAAIIRILQKLTDREAQKDVLEGMLNKELEMVDQGK